MVEFTFSVHLSYPFVANLRRALKSKSKNWSSFRPLGDAVLLASAQGCQVAPTLFDIHIPEIGCCNTVRSKDMNPNSMSSNRRPKKETWLGGYGNYRRPKNFKKPIVV